MGGDGYGSISCTIVRVSTKAALVATGEGDDHEENWIPFSLIDEYDLAEMEVGKRYDSLGVKEWFLEREGIE